MHSLSRLVTVFIVLIMTSAPSSAQLASFMETEVRVVEEDRVILPGGRVLPVLIQKPGIYGPLLDNYPMLLRVGYIELARLHIARGIVVQVEVLQLSQ